jgi:hypothetical protein
MPRALEFFLVLAIWISEVQVVASADDQGMICFAVEQK